MFNFSTWLGLRVAKSAKRPTKHTEWLHARLCKNSQVLHSCIFLTFCYTRCEKALRFQVKLSRKQTMCIVKSFYFNCSSFNAFAPFGWTCILQIPQCFFLASSHKFLLRVDSIQFEDFSLKWPHFFQDLIQIRPYVSLIWLQR